MSDDQDGCEWVNFLLVPACQGSPRLLNGCVCVCCVGKGKGTPALRRGIHCIGIDVEDESEQSDWQGFD